MRRVEQNLGEKRVLFQSVEKKNSLRITYERLKLEEKAFISSTKFNQRQLLSRQNKLRQLQSTSQNSKGLRSEKRPKFRSSFPELPGTSESVIRGYASNLTLPCSRKSLHSPREGKQSKSLLGKEAFDGKESRLGTSRKLVDATFKDVAHKRNEFKVPLEHDQAKFRGDSKTKQIRYSGLHVDDIIAYSVKFGERAEKSQKISSTGREHVDTTENRELSGENENFTVTNENIWKSDVDSLARTQGTMFDTIRFPEKEDRRIADSIQSSEKGNKVVKDCPMYIKSVERSPSVFSKKMKTGKESRMNDVEPTKALNAADWLPKNVNNLKHLGSLQTNYVPLNMDTTSDELKTAGKSQISSLENFQRQETGGQDVFISLNTDSSLLNQPDDEIEQPRPSSSIPPLVSQKPSWHGYKDLPALGRIRRGSFCDVKTFTSSKVLDLLSSCEVPSPDSEKKESTQYLDVNDENLKYCRYLRSVTPGEAIEDGESLKIPRKYRPSSTIIIGHTKVLPLQ